MLELKPPSNQRRGRKVGKSVAIVLCEMYYTVFTVTIVSGTYLFDFPYKPSFEGKQFYNCSLSLTTHDLFSRGIFKNARCFLHWKAMVS